jgi:hypothetical protein
VSPKQAAPLPEIRGAVADAFSQTMPAVGYSVLPRSRYTVTLAYSQEHPMGRALIGNRPMTAAERQRRHRAGLTAKSAVAKRAKRKPAASHRPKRRLRKSS